MLRSSLAALHSDSRLSAESTASRRSLPPTATEWARDILVRADVMSPAQADSSGGQLGEQLHTPRSIGIAGDTEWALSQAFRIFMDG